MEQLEKEAGGTCVNEQELVAEISDFYAKLFRSDDSIGWEDSLNGVTFTITDTMNSRLIRPMKDSEIKKVVFFMNPNKPQEWMV